MLGTGLAIPLIIGFVQVIGTDWLPAGDVALMEIRALDVPKELPLTGAWSRFGFDHPGPVVYYVAALPLRVLGPTGLTLTAVAVNAACLGGFVALLNRLVSTGRLVIAVLAVLLLVIGLSQDLLTIWNPWIAVLPYLLAVIATFAVTEKMWKAIPLQVILVTFAIQAHAGYGFLGAGLLLTTVIVIGSARRSAEAVPWRQLLTAGMIGAVLWLPPLAQQVTNDPGNLSSLITDSAGQDSVGLVGGAELMSVGLGPSFPWITGGEGVNPETTGTLPPYGPGWMFITIAPFLVALIVAFRSHDSVRWFGVVVAVQLAVGYATATLVDAARFNYLVRWSWVIAMLCWLFVAWIVAARAGPRMVRFHQGLPQVSAAVVTVGLAAATASIVTTPRFNDTAGSAVADVSGPTVALLQDAGVESVFVKSRGTASPWMFPGVAAELARSGIEIRVDDAQARRFGSHRGGRGSAAVEVVVAEGDDEIGRLEADRTARLAAATTPEQDPTTPEIQELRDQFLDRGVLAYIGMDEAERRDLVNAGIYPPLAVFVIGLDS